jgi:HAMP domain-containing protein
VYREHEAAFHHGGSIAREIVRQGWWHPDAHGELTAFLTAEASGAHRRSIWFIPPEAPPGGSPAWGGEAVRVVAPGAQPPFEVPPDGVLGAPAERSVVRSAEHGDVIWGAVPVVGPDGTVLGTVVIESVIPAELVAQLEGISKTYEDYNQLKTFKNPIKGGYILSFLIITLLIIFSATWFGYYVARGVTVPIQRLAEGTQAVAQGNLTSRSTWKPATSCARWSIHSTPTEIQNEQGAG